jgi:hypothetical protein
VASGVLELLEGVNDRLDVNKRSDRALVEWYGRASSIVDGMTQEYKEKINALIQSRGLVRAASNTKWNELVTFFRELDGWTPGYRAKLVNGVISDWDVEWFAHLPFPFVGIEV